MTFLCPFLIFAALILLPVQAFGAQTPQELPQTGSAHIKADAEELVLKEENGKNIKLAGVEAVDSYWQEKADARLNALTKGQKIILYQGGGKNRGKLDRYQRLLAHVVTADDGTWLQKILVAEGLVRVLPVKDTPELTRSLYVFEQEARENRRGIWSDPDYALRTPDNIHKDLNSTQIVEGEVVSAKEVRGRVYLNFGQDWRTDFTVSIAKQDQRAFKNAGLDPLSWKGQTLRVRGWIKSYNGPMIEATHPEQFEFPKEGLSVN